MEAERGFLALIAKPGTGKTTLLFHLLEKFRHHARTVFLFQTQCNSREFMRFLLAELGVEGPSQDLVDLHEEFNRMLLEESAADRRFIVVVDEAQNLDAAVLETIRLLSDFETPKAKLLQIILAGQPELADKLASPRLAQFRQRISLLNGLAPLSVEETGRYIGHRLRVAGYMGAPLFAPEALKAVAEFSSGIPRNVNNCCFNALSLGFTLGRKTVDVSVVEEAIHDLDISQHVSEHEKTPASDLKIDDLKTGGATFASVSLASSGSSEIQPSRSVPDGNDSVADRLTPAEAIAYMHQLSSRLKAARSSGG